MQKVSRGAITSLSKTPRKPGEASSVARKKLRTLKASLKVRQHKHRTNSSLRIKFVSRCFTHILHFALCTTRAPGNTCTQPEPRHQTFKRRESCRLKTCWNAYCVRCQKCVSNLQEETGCGAAHRKITWQGTRSPPLFRPSEKNSH